MRQFDRMNLGIPGKRTMPLLGGASLGVLLAACASNPSSDPGLDSIAGAKQALDTADSSLIVDCLLPGKVKKLGGQMTYISPRRPAKISSQECEIRGGEYVAYDRANFETALKVWLPMAEQGDMVAQTYVGAIYEKGMGVPADYAMAATWYRKAADQGYARAQYALGYLYEMGNGVQRNPEEAFLWYRRAAGLPEEQIKLTQLELDEREKARLAEATQAERATLQKVQEEVATQQAQLGDLQQRLNQAKAVLADKERQAKAQVALAQQAKKEQAQAKEQTETYAKQTAELEAQLDVKRGQLAQVDLELQQQKQVAQQRGDELRGLLDRIGQRKTALEGELAQLSIAAQSISQKQAATQDGAVQSALAEQAAKTATELQAKQIQLAEVDAALARQKAVAESKGQELLALMQQIEQRKASLQNELAAIEASQQQAAATRVQMSQDSATASAQQTQLDQEVARQRQLIAQLEQEAKKNQERLAYLQQVKSTDQVALVAPQIEIIDPVIPVLRSTDGAQVPVFAINDLVKERPVVGKVIAQDKVMVVTLNDVPLSISEKGVFNASVPVSPSGTLVNIVAVDVSGQRGESQFILSPQQKSRDATGADRDVVASAVKPVAIPNIEFGDYYALLIGNNSYTKLPQLETPIRDIEEIGGLLKDKYGFKDVSLLKNASRYDIITALNKLRQKLTEKDNLVIYYAGHGELDRVNMTGQWLPIDAEPENTANWISNSSLTELVNAITANHVLVVADSCYSGIMTRSALTNIQSAQSDDARTTWLKKMFKKRSRTVLTSGGVAPVLDEGGGDHSVFARAFISALRNNNEILEGQRLFRQVSAVVTLAADRYKVEQVPEYAPIRHAGHESGDFFFVPLRTGV